MDTGRTTIPAAEDILNRYFPVLDHGFVALIDYMGGDSAIERAARCSYTIGPEVRDIKETRRLIRYLFRHRHHSPFEMTEITVHLSMPIFVMRQFVRHRTAKINEFSGRYSPMPMLFYTPPHEDICHQAADNKQGRSGPVDDLTASIFQSALSWDREMSRQTYEWALDQGIARETARIDLPLSTYTYLYWKCDIRNLLHLIGLRSDPHAQKEIRAYSDVLAGIVRRVCPLAFNAFQDYEMDSVRFTQADLAAIRYLSSRIHSSPIVWEHPPADVRAEVEEYLRDEYGIKGREMAEFWGKIRVRPRRDFSLDIAQARDASYFLDEVNNHSVVSS